MVAIGARGTLLAPDETGGFELAVMSDAFLVRMTWEKLGGKSFVEAPKRMTGPGLYQCTEPVEWVAKGAGVDAGSPHPTPCLLELGVIG